MPLPTGGVEEWDTIQKAGYEGVANIHPQKGMQYLTSIHIYTYKETCTHIYKETDERMVGIQNVNGGWLTDLHFSGTFPSLTSLRMVQILNKESA